MTLLRLATKARSRINIHDPGSTMYWMRKFGVTRHELYVAVRSVGSRPNRVLGFIKGKASQDAWSR